MAGGRSLNNERPTIAKSRCWVKAVLNRGIKRPEKAGGKGRKWLASYRLASE